MMAAGSFSTLARRNFTMIDLTATGTTPVETITLDKKSLLQYNLTVKQQFHVIGQILDRAQMIQMDESTKEGA